MQKAFEKIAEKMKEEKASYFLTIANTDDEKLDAIYKAVANAIDRDIEIVNQVAEEYKSTEHINCSTNEVCEWSKMKNTQGYMRAKQHNNAEPNYKICVWKFCPYCGKKIKVVE